MAHISHVVSTKSSYRAQNNGEPAVNSARPNEEMTGQSNLGCSGHIMLTGQSLNNT